MDPECQLTWTPVPNMGAALTGYNPIIGNSLSGDRPDPGAKQQIFVPTFQKSDGRLDVHENIHFRDDVQCQLNTETKFVKSFQDYQSLKSNSWKLSQGSTQSSGSSTGLIPFIIDFSSRTSTSQSTTADSEFETEASFFGEQQGEIFYNQAKCTVFRIDVSSFSKSEFHPSFKDALRQLNKAAKEPTSRRSKEVLKAFISEFGTHYMSSAWLGATLTTETRFASKSENEGERRRRQDCIEESFGKATGTGVTVKEIRVNVNLQGGKIGGTTGGWGANSDSTFNREAKDCLKDDDNNRFYAENRFERTRITSVGSAPKADPEAWAEDVKSSPAVIDRELKEISSLFTEDFIGDIKEDDDNPSTGRLDPASMKEFFNNGLAKYCQLMLGEECPPVRGCGFSGLCRPDESCRNDNSTQLGFKCTKAPPPATTTTEKPVKRGCSGSLVLSSTAGAADYQGDLLGEYQEAGEWNGKSLWLQRDGKGKLFFGSFRKWAVTDEELKNDIVGVGLRSVSSSEQPPLTGWEFGDGFKWRRDQSMTLSCGPLVSCSQVTVSIPGDWQSEGVYRPTNTWKNGRPVYQQNEGTMELEVLQSPVSGRSSWGVYDTENANYVMKSGRATNSPGDPSAKSSEISEQTTWVLIVDDYHFDLDDEYNRNYDYEDYGWLPESVSVICG